MHSIVKTYYEKTRDSDYRNWLNSPSDEFMFDVDEYDLIEKESCIVGMLMAWSVVTLESLVNHALAETIDDRALAISSIEYPRKIAEKIRKADVSELAQKLIILSNGSVADDILSLADALSDRRNAIVHDKPFDIIQDNEDVNIKHLRLRGKPNDVNHRYEHLSAFYDDCKNICDFIENFCYVISPSGEDVDFSSLECG